MAPSGERVPDAPGRQPGLAVQETEDKCEARRVDHGPERCHAHGHEHHDRDEGTEVVAEPQQQFADRLDVHLHRPGLEPPGVHFDGEDDAEVVEDRGNGGPDQHLQVGDAQQRGDDEGCGAEGGRGHDGADTGSRQDGAAVFLRVAGLAQQRPGDAAEGHGGGDAGTGHGAEQEAGQGHGPAGARLRLPERGEREVDEEFGGARGAQHGAVDGEQNDVRRRDVGGNPEQPLRPHDVVADQPDPVEGRRVERCRDEGTECRIGEETHHDERDEDAHGPAGRLQRDQDRDHAHGQVEVGRRDCAAEEAVPVRDDVGERNHGDCGEQPVQYGRVVGLPASLAAAERPHPR